VEFETGFTPFFKLFKVNRLFLTALVRSWLALLYTLHKLTSLLLSKVADIARLPAPGIDFISKGFPILVQLELLPRS
jgi:hypothetical protein